MAVAVKIKSERDFWILLQFERQFRKSDAGRANRREIRRFTVLRDRHRRRSPLEVQNRTGIDHLRRRNHRAPDADLLFFQFEKIHRLGRVRRRFYCRVLHETYKQKVSYSIAQQLLTRIYRFF